MNAPIREWTGGLHYRDITDNGYPDRAVARLIRDAAMLRL
jgi:hypothetical protein